MLFNILISDLNDEIKDTLMKFGADPNWEGKWTLWKREAPCWIDWKSKCIRTLWRTNVISCTLENIIQDCITDWGLPRCGAGPGGQTAWEKKAQRGLYHHVPVFIEWLQRRWRLPFKRGHVEKMRGSGYRLFLGRLLLVTRGKCFTMRRIKHWNNLPRQVVDSPNTGCSQESSGQSAGPCLDHAFAKKGCTRWDLKSLPN